MGDLKINDGLMVTNGLIYKNSHSFIHSLTHSFIHSLTHTLYLSLSFYQVTSARPKCLKSLMLFKYEPKIVYNFTFLAHLSQGEDKNIDFLYSAQTKKLTCTKWKSNIFLEKLPFVIKKSFWSKNFRISPYLWVMMIAV